MMARWDTRYDSNSIATKISKMSELVWVSYSNPSSDIARHIDGMEALIEQLRSMKATIEDSLAIGILIACIDVHDLLPLTAAIKLVFENQVSWEAVSERFIDECKESKRKFKDRPKAANTG